jgi:hypothetical protein
LDSSLIHYIVEAFDPLTIIMVVGLCFIWAVVGWNLCKMRHRQHGLAVDKDFKVPDSLPPSWGPKVNA